MDFHKARTKAEKMRHQRFLLFVYAVAVTVALIISICHKSPVEASAPNAEQMADLTPEEFADYQDMAMADDLKLNADNAESNDPTVVFQEPSSEPQNMQSLLTPTNFQINEDIVTVTKGDSFIGILTGMGVEYVKADEIYDALKQVYDARNIKVGQEMLITSTIDSKYNELEYINKIVIEPQPGTRYIVEKQNDDTYQSRIEEDDLSVSVKGIRGVVNGNLSSAMREAGVPNNIIGNFINIFAFSLDFSRDMRDGDKFEVRYEEQLAPDGTLVKTGDILYAALELRNDTLELYRFEDKNGNVDYYDEKGRALKKSLDKKPMEFKRARISSRFGRRFHPILKTYKHHDGVDYAAPTGTKVYASADGVVTMSKWYGGYGNYVKIRHNSEYSTAYGHLKSFAKGIRPGVRVKQGQVIAYVGNTGRSTGPHLHFEVIQNGRKVDPLKIRAATGENLKGNKLAEFKKVVAEIKADANNEKEVATNTQTDQIGQLIDSVANNPDKI